MHTLLHSVPQTLQQVIANPRLCQRLLDTHRHVWISLLLGHCSFSWVQACTRFCLYPLRVCFPSPGVNSGGSMVGIMANSLKRAVSYPGLLHPEHLPLWQATADPYFCRRCSNTQRQVWLSLCGLSYCTQSFV